MEYVHVNPNGLIYFIHIMHGYVVIIFLKQRADSHSWCQLWFDLL